ncbi:MAG: TetR/AcrR family transcriptional regulator [Xanthomonadales bacterium]|nr:TetR/AcrR family transcriptional regulator [Gammaproteobacteria bacterium]MBT8050320.1 TetR/AcrR family transcriptional regulator [Gammaproteobacteria bacterium]MBT8056294.1 TetR/AcrR family transcriptional regulator [Gammaproteobacteria bacterium]NNJ79887.1 TetR/AcrR family transcriptional regulator [Xanthomonadales bacterium]NNL04195.1 TetR/AcrR family transcriptional regulator [Xanthomonadales bacterium]
MSQSLKHATDPGRSAGENAILEAAVRLFSRHGFEGVSMRAVAQEAGVSKSNIYHHFASKEALYLAIMQSSAGSLAEMVENLAEGRGGFDERLREFALAHLVHLIDNAMTMRLLLREVFTGDSRWQKIMVEQVVGGIFERLIGIFENGQKAGLLRPGVDPGLCALLILGIDLFHFQTRHLHQYPPLDRYAQSAEQFSSEMMDIILHGMLAPTVASPTVAEVKS